MCVILFVESYNFVSKEKYYNEPEDEGTAYELTEVTVKERKVLEW